MILLPHLVIDPTLMFCSFAGSTADNWGYTATYGPDGSFYGGGIVLCEEIHGLFLRELFKPLSRVDFQQ